MRVFVAGATGALGKQLVPMLAEQGHEVTGMTRSPAKRNRFASWALGPSWPMRSIRRPWRRR